MIMHNFKFILYTLNTEIKMHPKQTVPGEYYQVTKQGYRHVGNRFVEVSNNPNYL